MVRVSSHGRVRTDAAHPAPIVVGLVSPRDPGRTPAPVAGGPTAGSPPDSRNPRLRSMMEEGGGQTTSLRGPSTSIRLRRTAFAMKRGTSVFIVDSFKSRAPSGFWPFGTNGVATRLCALCSKSLDNHLNTIRL